MLECLVFGRRAAQFISAGGCGAAPRAEVRVEDIPVKPRSDIDYAALRATVQGLMSEHCHVVRKVGGLELALGHVGGIKAQLEGSRGESNAYVEALNIATVAKAILEAALGRRESIGSHYVEY